ncbi:SMP-30/gluconolactonase/LRE family protein [Paenibacillus sp. MMS20-IR301]|uniref:SMP-30/gluconolactonase/LRE family protein n=1 Tax=Paenibacillus sp. MMS20-IR301 TaxID=2895946 RepID=UPI0028ECE620|nr:SMP-30/gluconolactonase/LRE family protein [Paenibacillus sp. MMS20-IR301]WNS44594.1 SMP-30/gluconolactonase/LRE family protein [Paenibacillus sp. MMS20-IR301]
MTGLIELVIDSKSLLGEGPHWDAAAGKLSWVDIEGRELRVYDPRRGEEDRYFFEQKVGAAVPAQGGGWILAMQDASGRRTVVRFAEGDGWPDGMTIDCEGMLWIAHYKGSCISRWNPHTGERLAAIEVPAHCVTSCTFGGEHLDELYITTARGGMSAAQLERWPLAGGLFRVKPGVRGLAGNYTR